MELDVIRYSHGRYSTLGLYMVNGKFSCYTLEDAFHVVKIPGETRIPNGRRKVELRTEGSHHERYKRRFPDMHKGMLHVIDVPNYTYILIHIGNYTDDTEGCLLVGEQSMTNIQAPGRIADSTKAYKRIYPPVAKAILSGEEVWINYRDL